MGDMRLGVAVTAITPAPGLAMGGYTARQGKACGAHDPLTARTLVLEQDGRFVALTVADLLMFPRRQSERIRRRAAALAGLDPAELILAATHTHSAPLTFDAPFLGGEADPVYVAWLEEQIAWTVSQAVERLKPVRRVLWGRAPVEGVGAVRRATAGPPPAAGDVTVIGFESPRGALRAVLMHYACHPTVMGADNLLYTADLAGAARAAFERETGVPALYLNGACGDVSTRFTRRAQSFDELERLGSIIGRAAAEALSGAVAAEPALWAGSASVQLPLRSLPTLDEALAAVAATEAEWRRLRAAEPGADPAAVRLARVAYEGAQVQALLAGQAAGTVPGGGASLESEAVLSAVRLAADCGLVTIPGELFFSLGEAVQRNCGLPCCLPVGYAGGHLGYIPDEAAYAEGGYEVLSSHLARGAGMVLAEAAAALLREGGN